MNELLKEADHFFLYHLLRTTTLYLQTINETLLQIFNEIRLVHAGGGLWGVLSAPFLMNGGIILTGGSTWAFKVKPFLLHQQFSYLVHFTKNCFYYLRVSCGILLVFRQFYCGQYVWLGRCF